MIQLPARKHIYGQDKVVALDSFCPNEVTFEDREAGLCTVSQYPTQAVKMASGDGASQMTCQSQDLNCLRTELTGGISDRAEANHTCPVNKRAKLSDTDVCKSTLPSIKSPINPTCEINTKKICQNEKPVEVSFAVPDVAAAIEDLLEETSKVITKSIVALRQWLTVILLIFFDFWL